MWSCVTFIGAAQKRFVLADVQYARLLFCRSLNYLSVNWYRKTASGRTLIQNDGIKYLLSMYRRRLTVKTPVTADSGVYVCEASFQRPGGPTYPPATAFANLTVQGTCNVQRLATFEEHFWQQPKQFFLQQKMLNVCFGGDRVQENLVNRFAA